MLSKIVSVLLIVLAINSILSQDICSFLKPNGIYEGLGIYKWYRDVDNYEYYLYNRNGTEWRFNFHLNKSDYNLELIESPNNIRTFNKAIIKKFGIYYKIQGQFDATFVSANCEIYDSEPKTIYCSDSDKIYSFKEYEEFENNTIVFRANAVEVEFAYKALILNKLTRNRLYFDHRNKKFELGLFGDSPKLKFINEMNASQLLRLDGVVDLPFLLKSGFILLFNIDNRPKYCYTLEFKGASHAGLSESCKSIHSLKPLYDECFEEITDTTETMPTDDEPEKSKTWIIITIIIVIVVILMIVIGCIWYWMCRKDPNEESGTTLHSVTTKKSSAISKTESKTVSKTVSKSQKSRQDITSKTPTKKSKDVSKKPKKSPVKGKPSAKPSGSPKK